MKTHFDEMDSEYIVTIELTHGELAVIDALVNTNVAANVPGAGGPGNKESRDFAQLAGKLVAKMGIDRFKQLGHKINNYHQNLHKGQVDVQLN